MKKIYQYQIVSEQRAPAGHTLYFLRYVSKHDAVSEMWVGVTKLKTLYNQGKLTGNMSDQVRSIVGRDKKKERAKGKLKLTPRIENEPVAPGWNLPDEFKVEAQSVVGIAYIFEKDGRWCVMQPDGTLDEDTYPTKEWAQEWANTLNKNEVS